jgi:drug/metabolite transporter (DMT)-like permease
MLYLIITILLNTYLQLIFKVFDRKKVDTLQAIVFNYWTCVITGCIFSGTMPLAGDALKQPWIFWAAGMGLAFISIFNLVGYCTKVDGITTTTVANKLSMVIPVGAAIWLYQDVMPLTKWIGIGLALPAVYLSAKVPGKDGKNSNIWLAILLFIASGLLDTAVNYVSHTFFSTGNEAVDEQAQSVYLVHAFLTAALAGSVMLLILCLRGRRKFAWKNLVAGVALGVPNYFSIYFLIRLLQTGFLPGSAAIPANNIGIVVLAALCAILFFREKAGPARITGMALALAAILLILIADLNAAS